MRLYGGAIIFILLLQGSVESFAGGLRDFHDSWLISSSTTRVLLDQREKPEAGGHGFMLMLGQGRLFDMPELNQQFLAMEGRFSSGVFLLRMAGLWERTGTQLFVEDHLGGKICLGNSPSWGLSANWSRQTLGGMEEDPVLELGLLWEVRFHLGDFNGSFELDWPLNTEGESPGDGRRRNIGKFSLASPNFATAIVIDRQASGVPKPGLHFLVPLDAGVGLELRADPATGSLGPGLSLVRGKLMMRTSHVVHPHLGITHRWLLVVGKSGGGL